ncbi:MAG: adenylate/guanylate cyclase domain-containing protein [Elusimicrobiota bacterium]
MLRKALSRDSLKSLVPSLTRQKKGLRWLLAYSILPTILLGSAIGLWWSDAGMLVTLRNWVFDATMRARPRPYDPAVPVRIIDIDDESLARVGQWPWPRSVIARFVGRLNEAGAAAVAFDVVFAEPDRTSPDRIADGLSGTAGVETVQRTLRRMKSHDRILAQALQEGRAVTAFSLMTRKNDARPLVKARFVFSTKGAQDRPADFMPSEYQGAVVSLPVLQEAAAGNGCFSNIPDADGVIRRVPLLYKIGEEMFPSLAGEALRLALGSPGYKVKSAGGSGEESYGAQTGIATVQIAGVRVRIDESGRALASELASPLLRYVVENHLRLGRFRVTEKMVKAGGATVPIDVPTEPAGNVVLYDTGYVPERYIPVWRVLSKDFDPKEVEGKILFVGTSAAGLKDQRATPLNQVTSGVELHSQVCEQALTGRFLERPDWGAGVEFTLMLVLGLLLIVLMPKLGAAWCALIAGGGLAFAFGGSWIAYTRHQLLLDPVFPSLVASLIYVSTSLINYLRSESEKKQVRGAFSRYMSPALVEQLAADPTKLKLGGETRELTIMFSDIRGFTTISEQFDSAGLTVFINRYLTPMTGIVLENKGTIDKYIGDCIMAFWNAPLDDADHARNACRTALGMRSGLKVLNEEWRQIAEAEGRKHIPIKTGIGLNTGPCCVGNLGSEQRFDYSVLGDDVNLSSRLEGQSKNYGVDIVIGENTRAKTPEFAGLELDLIRVKGKTVPVHIFTLLGDEAFAETPGFLKTAEKHGAMLQAYRSQKWIQAMALLRECRELEPSLGALYDLYTQRIEGFRAKPPGEGWDGVFVATSK